MLAIELDGYTHSFKEVFERDNLKEQSLQELGITILRFKDEDVMNDVEGVITYIEECIKGIEKNTPLYPLLI